MNQVPIISIVMPVYNGETFLTEAIDSVLSQTFPDFELIIVNDGSTDNSGSLVHSYTDSRIRVIDFHEKRGCFPARNAGMRVARGKYIAVMDADDRCFPKRLEIQFRFLEENPGIGLIGGAFKLLNENQPIPPMSIYKVDQISTFMINQWIDRLLEANRRIRYYNQEKMQDFLQAHHYYIQQQAYT